MPVVPAAAAILFAAAPGRAAAVCATWAAGISGNWNTAAAWAPAGVPGNGVDVCVTDGSSTVSLSAKAGIGDLTIAGGNAVSVAPGGVLSLGGSGSFNAGTPEPATAALLIGSLAGLGAARRRSPPR